jgi:hypothetical protein
VGADDGDDLALGDQGDDDEGQRNPSGAMPVRLSWVQSPQIWLVRVRTATPVNVPSRGIVEPRPLGVSPASPRTRMESEVGCEAMAPAQPSTDQAASASSWKMTTGSGGAQASIRWALMTACS